MSKYRLHLETIFVFLLAASVRLTSLGVFRVVDEEDRWAWAVDFYRALLAGDLSATLVGDGYPGIFPAWLETLWLFAVSLYRSVLQGSWLGDEGVYLLIHEWERLSHLAWQRFPVALANTLLVVGIFWYTRKLFGSRVALLSAILISLDPFYLSDSRVNRAEALLTGLMTLSMLALLAALRAEGGLNRRQFLASAVFGGLAWLTKSQALVLLPMFGLITLFWYLQDEIWPAEVLPLTPSQGEGGQKASPPLGGIEGGLEPTERSWQRGLRRWLGTMAAWTGLAALTFLLLWPATWTVPGPTFALMTRYLTRKVGEEGVKLFFLGQTVLDEDPGLLFYPLIFLLRVTPLMLAGLLLGIGLLIHYSRGRSLSNWRDFASRDSRGVWVLILFALLYVGGMSLGSHKQDRFLMTIFPTLGILAALAFVRFVQERGWSQRQVWLAGGALLAIQLATVLPFHPYYFSYFNPLTGGGPMASRITRIGWGEGMDQVADYLNTLENPNSLQVAARFYKYLVGFKGRTINLDAGGEWARADKIVFYIQQTQRMLDPSPGVIRYFQQHIAPEKVITIDGIDYAWVYPNPVTYPADLMVDRVAGELALFGYRWETEPAGAVAWLVWENLGRGDGPVGVRLWGGETNHSSWLPCDVAPGFESATKTAGEVVESVCPLSAKGLSPGLYSLQVGMNQSGESWLPLDFAAGWAAVEVAADGLMDRVAPEVAFARLADRAIPPDATRLERAYDHRIRLLAYELSPEQLHPGQSLALTLYWQAVRPLDHDIDVTIQAFVGQERVALLNGPPVGGSRPTKTWQPGEVIRDTWSVPLPAELPAPALLRLDVGLFRPQTLIPLQVRNLEGEDIPAAITMLPIKSEIWPGYEGEHPLVFTFEGAIDLLGYDLTRSTDGNTLDLTLYWQSLAPLPEDYTAFVHLLTPDGRLAAQSDVPPASGLYPISAWQPGEIVTSHHRLELPPGLPGGTYTLLAGLYHPIDWTRLSPRDADGQPLPDDAAPIGQLTLP
jgi:hypothetical protein